MSDTELMYDSDQDVSESHSKLIEAVAQLDKGQRVKKPERSEPTLEVSEFHLVKSGISDKDAVHVHDLVKALGKKGHHAEITKKLEATKKKAKLLHKPMEKPAADRIKRMVGFENTKKDVEKWNGIITRNRTTETIHYPLIQPSMKLESSNEFVKRFRLQSDLEKELAALEPQKENVEEKGDEFSMTLQEIIMKRKEAARLRAQQSYKEAKAHRQKKIKSKKFHRVQRKEKVKLQLKEFEALQKTDPEAALEKLEQLDKTRAEERMTLRHKSTGQWAKNKQIRAKYDKETRQELAQQLSISRELTQKIKKGHDTDEEDEEIEEANAPFQLSASDKENPWVTNNKTESEIDEFVKSYRKYWDEQTKKVESKSQDINNKSEKDTKTVKSSKDEHLASDFDEDEDSGKECETTSEIVDHKNTTQVKISENGIITENSSDEASEKEETVVLDETVAKKKLLRKPSDRKKKNLRKKSETKFASTSTWDVEPVEDENHKTQKPYTRQTFDQPSAEKINELFDSMEDKIENKVKSKLERMKRKYDTVPKKTKRKVQDNEDSDEDHFNGLEMSSKRQKPIFDEAMHETTGEDNPQIERDVETLKNIENGIDVLAPIILAPKANKSDAEIDPNKYINVKPKQLHTQLPDVVTGGDDALDDSEGDEEKHNIISEAFADDDVVDEFRKEKQEEIEKSKPEDIDLTLPGWGSWGGRNIRTSKRKRKRFIVKLPKDAPRKDENKGDVIIIEENNPKLKEHRVTELPYPFTSVKDFEASIRMPIGRNFVSENAHKRLIEPAVKTDMGKIIEPMSEDVLIKRADKKKQKFERGTKKTSVVNKNKVIRKPKIGNKKK